MTSTMTTNSSLTPSIRPPVIRSVSFSKTGDVNIIEQAINILKPLENNTGPIRKVKIEYDVKSKEEARAIAAAIVFANEVGRVRSHGSQGTLEDLVKQHNFHSNRKSAEIKFIPRNTDKNNWKDAINAAIRELEEFRNRCYENCAGSEKRFFSAAKRPEQMAVFEFPIDKNVGNLFRELVDIIAVAHGINQPRQNTAWNGIMPPSANVETFAQNEPDGTPPVVDVQAEAARREAAAAREAARKEQDRIATEQATRAQEAQIVIARNPKPYAIPDTIQKHLRNAAPHGKENTKNILQTAITAFAAALDTRDEDTLQKAQYSESDYARAAATIRIHAQLKDALLSDATLALTAYGAGVPKIFGAPYDPKNHPRTGNRNAERLKKLLTEKPEALQLLKKVSQEAPGIVLLVKAALDPANYSTTAPDMLNSIHSSQINTEAMLDELVPSQTHRRA